MKINWIKLFGLNEDFYDYNTTFRTLPGNGSMYDFDHPVVIDIEDQLNKRTQNMPLESLF
ncbi:hypothetical protein KAR48_10890 [bacterium]|nr:hypothetical protein [bacterium]